MLVVTNKRPIKKSDEIDYIVIICRIPKNNLAKAEKAISEISGQVEAIPWRQVYPDFNAGTALRGARYKENLTQEKLAGLLGIKQIHISEMENNKRTIGKEMAKRFAEVLHVDYRIFL